MSYDALNITSPAVKKLAALLLDQEKTITSKLSYDAFTNETLTRDGTITGTDQKGRVAVQRIAHLIRVIAYAHTDNGHIGVMDHFSEGEMSDEKLNEFATRALDAIRTGTPLSDSFPGNKIQGHR